MEFHMLRLRSQKKIHKKKNTAKKKRAEQNLTRNEPFSFEYDHIYTWYIEYLISEKPKRLHNIVACAVFFLSISKIEVLPEMKIDTKK